MVPTKLWRPRTERMAGMAVLGHDPDLAKLRHQDASSFLDTIKGFTVRRDCTWAAEARSVIVREEVVVDPAPSCSERRFHAS